jgi:N6-L-threonylcarbamoyladenine synthase
MIKVLGIETSCDDTAVAIVTDSKEILFNEVISQTKEHERYGGVVPEIASRSHLDYLDQLLDKVSLHDIDAIAVTRGPGLIGGVVVGVMYAKAIAAALDKPIIGVDHLEGHALTVRLTSDIEYPYLLLLVSGGHTRFVAINDVNDYIKLGDTLDDALGEAFDKVAKVLGLGYPGGPVIERMALSGNPHAFKFPMPLSKIDSCDFSFSGLKTSVKYKVDALGELDEQTMNDIAASFQYTVGEILKTKLVKAIAQYGSKSNRFVLSGGVAANKYLRGLLEETCQEHRFEFYAPPIGLCADNAAMIAWAGIERFKAGLVDGLGFGAYSRSSL